MTTAMISQLPDQDLVRHFKADQNQAFFGEIYKRYYRNVFRICLAINKDPDTASDLAQDVMIKVMEKLPDLQHEYLLGWWIHSIARNETITYCKKHQKKHHLSVNDYPEVAAEEMDVESLKDREALFEDLGEAMDALNEESRNMLTLKYLHNTSIKELQQKYELSESAVKMRLARARDRVLEVYRQNHDPRRRATKKAAAYSLAG